MISNRTIINESLWLTNKKITDLVCRLTTYKFIDIFFSVSRILLQNDLVDIDKQDYDGWTPLHAAAHWGQRDAAKLLVDNLADMEIKNFYVSYQLFFR